MAEDADVKEKSEAPAIDAKITDEDIERARRQIDVPKFGYEPPFNMVACRNSMSHFAFGIGDDNPLWHDPDYGRKSRWRGQIASPLYLISTGINEAPKPTGERKELFKGLFRGVGKYFTGVSWEWYRPLYAGEEVFLEDTTSNIEVKENSKFGGGRVVFETFRYLYVNRAGEPIACREESYMNAERGGSKKAGKNESITRQSYTREDIAEIDAKYAAEERRGSLPRYFEDVNVGDELVPVVKGPLTVLDIMGMHIGWGMGDYNIGPLRYAWKRRTKMPAFYVEDEYGVPDAMQRLHWDEKRARQLGLPAPYDYGQMRTTWLAHLVTNWMGDDAWLWKLSNQMRAFNFQGDTHTCTGRVVGKREENGHCIVDLAIEATNQRGQVTAPGTASVILPSRVHGAVTLPRPPEKFVQRGANMMAEAAARLRGEA